MRANIPGVGISLIPHLKELPFNGLRRFQIVSLWDMITTFPAGKFLDAVQHLRLLGIQCSGQSSSNTSLENNVSDALIRIRQLCEESKLHEDRGMAVSLSTIKCQLDFIQLGCFLPNAVGPELSKIARDVATELDLILFLHITPGDATNFRNPAPFGDEVYRLHKPARDDIQEASKCMALDRFTACVLHLMRVAEYGVERLCKKQGVTLVPLDDWGAMLGKLKAKFAIPSISSKKMTARQLAKKEKLNDLVIFLALVKDVWRNKAMHRVRVNYDKHKATTIMNQVKDFMQDLAGSKKRT